MPFTVATYNILANAYLRHGNYSAVNPEVLDPDLRLSAVVKRVAGLGADLLCLQEVETGAFTALQEHLLPLGYLGHLEPKVRKQEGSALFYRATAFRFREALRVEFHDNEKGPGEHSGFVAVVLLLENEGRALGVASTHLRWDKEGTPLADQFGHRQAVELIRECRKRCPAAAGLVICGDFNHGPASEVVAAFRGSGFEFSHAGMDIHSAVANGKASLIDHLFHNGALHSRPIGTTELQDGAVLPSEMEPSDHLPLQAEFRWIPQS